MLAVWPGFWIDGGVVTLAVLVGVLIVYIERYRRAVAVQQEETEGVKATRAELNRRLEQGTSELVEWNRVLRQEIGRRSAVEESLRKSEAMARGMFETAVDAIITIDTKGVIAAFNPAAERLFGYAASEVIGKNVSTLMPQPHRRDHDGYVERYMMTGQKRVIGIGREVVARRKDGTTFPIELAVGEQWAGEQRIFTAFVHDLTARKRLEAEVLQIAEREQERIGQDLHDGLGQHLTGLAFLAKGLASRLRAQGVNSVADAEKLNELLNQAVSQTRALSRGLQPLEDAADLRVALENLCESVRDVFSIECYLHAEETPGITELSTATHLYRIAQEAVNNSIRHGKARCIEISLRQVDGKVRLVVQDDGVGFGEVPGTGIGLRTMHYRARTIGANLDVRPGQPAGVVVTCEFEISTETESAI